MSTRELVDLREKLALLKPFANPEFKDDEQRRINGDPNWYDCVFNVNSFPFDTDMAIIVTSWNGQLRWLKKTLLNYRLTGKYVILSYDNPFYAFDPSSLSDQTAFDEKLLRSIHYLMAHSVVVKHKTFDADKRTGWFWDVKYAQGIINLFPNIKYVYCTNGDCILEKPENIDQLKDILGDGDLMSGQSAPGNTIHTADVIYKVDAFNKIMGYMTEQFKVPVLGSFSPECLLGEAVTMLDLKVTHAPVQPISLLDGSIDYYCREGVPSTFRDVIGFRNLYAEQEYRENNALEPLPREYIDDYKNYSYLDPGVRPTLAMYYKTKDRRYLYQYWMMGEDSWYNRMFVPLDFFGSEPIYDTNSHIWAGY